MKFTFRTRKSGLMANQQAINMSRVPCKVEVVVQHKLLQDSERTSAMVTRWSMYGRMPTQMHPHETKQKDQGETMGRLESSVTFRHNGQQGCERLHKNTSIQEQRFNHGPNSRGSARGGWRNVASKSTSTYALFDQQCRQSRSRRVLSTIATLI